MKRVLITLVAMIMAFVFADCATPRQPQPDYEKVRKDHKNAQKDLRKEEDRKDEESD
jgi:hypothetical protein